MSTDLLYMELSTFLPHTLCGLRLIPIPKGTLPTARRASVKELGVWHDCVLRSKATINNKIEKIKLTKYSYLGMIKTLIYILI